MEVKDLCKATKMQMAATALANEIIKYVKSTRTKTKEPRSHENVVFCIIPLKDFLNILQITKMKDTN